MRRLSKNNLKAIGGNGRDSTAWQKLQTDFEPVQS
jgi:hypothetical protein